MRWRITRWNCAGRRLRPGARAVVHHENIFEYMEDTYGAHLYACDLTGKHNWWAFRDESGAEFNVMQITKGKVIA